MKARSTTGEAHHSVTASISMFVSRNVFDFSFPWVTVAAVVYVLYKAHGKAIYCFPIISTNGKRIDGSNNAFRHCYVSWIVDLLCCDISPSVFLSEIRRIQANEKEAGVVAVVWGPMLTNNIDTLSIEEQQATIRRR